MFKDLHMGRSWTGHGIEDACPCPQESCGLVDLDRVSPDCDQHPVEHGRTLRQVHIIDECPGKGN